MMTEMRIIACCLLVAGIFGCNEAPPPSDPIVDSPQIDSPSPEFKLSREAAKQKAWETPVIEEAPPLVEVPADEPRRKTVFESLYQAVRNGAAEAMSEEGAVP